MATAHPETTGEKVSMILDRAGSRYTWIVAIVLVGGPLVAYAIGNPSLQFYIHITIGAFWFGLDFFFKYVLLPGLDESPPDAVGRIMPQVTPKIMVMADGLTVGTILSGLLLATTLGYWGNAAVQPYLHAAVGLAALMFLNAFIPLHVFQADLVAELLSEAPDPERIEHLNGRAETFGFLMTILMLLIFVMMVGMRRLGGMPF